MSSHLRNVLLLAYYFPPESESGAARPARFFKYLPEFGYRPIVVTASPQEDAPFMPEGHEGIVRYAPPPVRYGNKTSLPGIAEGVVRRLFFPSDDATIWAWWAFQASRKIMRSMPVDAVISTFPPINGHLAALALKRVFKLPWIADFRDPLVGNAFRFPGLPHFADRHLQTRFFNSADMILTVTDTLVESWKQRWPRWSSKFHLLWNGFDPSEPLAARPVPSGDARLLTHVGTLYGSRDPAPILYSLKRLIEKRAVGPTRVKLIGSMDPKIAARHQLLLDWMQAHGAIEMSSGLVPRDRALTAMAEADWLLLVDVMHGQGSGYAVPAKFFEYARVGRPILLFTDRNSTMDRILPQTGVRHCCIYLDDSDAIFDAKLLDFLEGDASFTKANSWFEEQFDGRKQVQTLAGWLDILCRRGAGREPEHDSMSSTGSA
ncbi:MAG: glycosyltransferase [Acidobacteriota bacterium]|nr:glycosyltransferase [Acidobacteriota bacterium]